MVGSSFNPRPQSINEVADYVLKRLGVQLQEVNITEEQLIDRISDAIVYFQEHHADGSIENYFKVKIAATKLTLNTSTQGLVSIHQDIQGPGWAAKVHSQSSDFLTIEICDYYIKDEDAKIANGQEIKIGDSTFSIQSFTLGTAEIGYVTIPNNVESILKIAELKSPTAPGMYDPFGTWTNQIFHYKGSGLAITFYLQELRNDTLAAINNLNPWADFNRYMNRAYLNGYNYNENIGNWLIMKVIVAIDPEEYPKMYGDHWFLRYCVELTRRQWAENLIKYDEVALLNGVKVNGTKLLEIADTRIKELEEEMFSVYRMPDDFFLA